MLEVVMTFNEGATRYYKGEVVSEQNFPAERIAVFKAHGWVKEKGDDAVPRATSDAVTLDIHDGRIGQTTKVI